MNKIINEITETATNAVGEKLSDLTDLEKLCIALVAGCSWEFSGNGIRLKNPVAFSEIDGKIIVHERV